MNMLYCTEIILGILNICSLIWLLIIPFGDTLFIDHLNKELLQIIVPDLFSLYSFQDYTYHPNLILPFAKEQDLYERKH